ncbi:MAG TPA: filamentous hemagglutinin family protein, partial [Burkholderiaceae bacterium]|nr:filamentous hemagglutinin family protein [Burkholderiaceae bacterium]
IDGLYEAGGARLDVTAGRDFRWQAAHDPLISEPGLRLLTENGTIDANARRDATFGYVADAYYTQDQALTGLDGDSSASVQASGGNVSMLLTQELPFNGYANNYNDYVTAQFSVAAPGGSMRIGDAEAMGSGGVELDQIPVQQSSFQLLAAGDLTVAHSATFTIDVQGTADLSKGPQFVQDLSAGVPHSALDESDRTPVHIASANGDVALAQLITARPVRIDAGQDVILPAYVSITHQDTGISGTTGVGETSSIQAGRDVLLEPDYRNLITGGVNIAGPGELLVLAGRDVNLGSGVAGTSVAYVSGLISTGNTTNGLLPSVGANITVIAGLRADGSDYARAVRMGFAELGATGLTDHAGDLYALLMATGNGNVDLGSTQAQAFDGESAAQQLAQVRTLVGQAVYDAQVANYVRAQPGQSGLGDAQALAAFASLSATKQAAAPGVILAQAFAGRPQAQRDAFIAELAGAAGTSTYPAALLAYMEQVQGTSLTLDAAITAFEALPLVRQIPLLDQVLVAEVRTNGRAAAGASGSAQEDAYDRGYRTIATLFPGDRPEGAIEMPEAAVKTLQDASITLLTPGGGVDAGGLSASTISPNNLGVVTVAGGDISAIVRDDFLVNQSRVFTLAPGDLMIWSSEGNIDAGRGAKTVVGSPAPVLRIDPITGLLFLDTSGSFTGSGIAVLDPASTLDLYAPAGAIDAGEAGIKSAGNAFFAAQTFIGTDNLSVGGHSVGAPPPVNGTATVALASAGNALAANANQVADDQKEERRKRRLRRNLLIEFLGFGPAS